MAEREKKGAAPPAQGPEERAWQEDRPLLNGRPYDAAGDLPGVQRNDPDRVYRAGVHDQRLPAKRRTRGK